jgi:hypothetical protein
MRYLFGLFILISLSCEAQNKGIFILPPVYSVAPALSATTANMGDVITGSNGTASPTPTSYTYQWMNAGVDIGGATSSSYTISYLDNAAVLTCKVTPFRSGSRGATTTSSNATTVFSIAGISHNEGWYDVNNASNTVVSGNMQSLKDKTSNARHMTVTNDSYPVYTSSGGANSLGYITLNTGFSIRTPTFTAVNPPLRVYTIYAQNSFVDGSQIYNLTGSNGFFSQNVTTSGNCLQMHGGSTFGQCTNGSPLNTWQLVTANWDNTHGYIQINNEPYKKDGYAQQGQVGGSEVLAQVGFYKTGASAISNFKVSEMIIVSSSISNTDDKNIRLYLTQKYNLVNNKFAVFFGNSITTGAAADDLNAHGFPTLAAQAKGYDYITIGYPSSVAVIDGGSFYTGVPGENLADVYTRVTSSNTDWINGYYFFGYGTNDQNEDATWIAAYTAIIQTFITAGVPLSHIIIMGTPSRATPVQATIASNLGVNYFDVWTYFNGYPSGGQPALVAVDGIHPNTLGHSYWATGLLTYLP